MKTARSLPAGLAFGALGVLASTPAWAWPDKPVEIVVGFAPGGGTDITARILAAYPGKVLGATVLVVKKPRTD
jgi:tripartite-type tricarboxylate transporter receptor subunit TctC